MGVSAIFSKQIEEGNSMELEEIKKKDGAYIAGTYNRFDLELVSGENATLRGSDGREYIDFASGIAVNSFGVNDEAWKRAVTDQLGRIQHACNLYYTAPQVRLAELLCKRTGAKKVFFGNSGAEANECAIKAARKYSFDRYGEGRYEIITLKNSFHGRTIATLTATGQDSLHRYFGPFLEGFAYAEPNIASVKSLVSEKTCAIMMELIQGESGVSLLEREFVLAVKRLCEERDILFIDDEVQTGNGRTGYLYACDYFGVEPDILTTAKGLGGGLPIGACLLYEKVQKTFTPGTHGTTFGGNPVVCAGAFSILERLTEDMLLEIQGKSAYLRAKLRYLPGVTAVTGLGLMIGLEVKGNAREIAERCLERGLLVLTAHSRLRLLPPLTITKNEMDSGITILNEVLAK